jgi:hypothetical protein
MSLISDIKGFIVNNTYRLLLPSSIGQRNQALTYVSNNILTWQDFLVEHPGYISGRYYSTPSITPNTQAFVANNFMLNLFPVRRRMSVDRISINVTVAASSGTNCRLGVYDIQNSRPANLIVDAGEVNVSTTGIKEIAISLTLDPGLYALAVFFNANPTVVGATENFYHSNMTGALLPATTGQAGYSVSGLTYSSLPSAISPGNVNSTNRVPVAWFRSA